MIELRAVNSSNVWRIVNLSVNDEQKDFVATNAESIIEAYTTIIENNVALPFGIYNDDELIGFVMFGYGRINDNDPEIAIDNYVIWRFMIDKKYQGQGFGKLALQESLEYLKTMPCGQAEYCWLSYEPENNGARVLYSSAGFQENGEICDDEIVSVLKL